MLILFGVLLPVIIGGMALSVDTGMVGAARTQLQVAADAAALAGARELATDARIVNTSASMTAPIAAALLLVAAMLLIGSKLVTKRLAQVQA